MTESASIHIGPSSRLYTVDHYYKAFAPFGVTRVGFVRFLRALHVPRIKIGRYDFVDHLTFTIALRAISRIGSSDFALPGHRKILKPIAERTFVTKLDPSSVEANLRSILSELLYARVQPESDATQRAFADAVNAAASRLTTEVFAELPIRTQNEIARATVAKLAPQLLAPDPTDPSVPLYTSQPLTP